MHRANTLHFAIIQFILCIDSTCQSQSKQAIIAFKAIGKAIKKPIVKTIGNTIKNSVASFRRNKNIVKNISCGLEEKYIKTSHIFGNGSVKILKEEGVKKFKYMTSYASRGGKHLFKTENKKNVQTKSAAQINGIGLNPKIKKSSGYVLGKELRSLINMVSKSKPLLPFLFAAGGLHRITQMNLTNELYKMHEPTFNSGEPHEEETYGKDVGDTEDEIDRYKKEMYKELEDDLNKRNYERGDWETNPNAFSLQSVKDKFYKKNPKLARANQATKDRIEEYVGKNILTIEGVKEKYLQRTKNARRKNKDYCRELTTREKELTKEVLEINDEISKIFCGANDCYVWDVHNGPPKPKTIVHDEAALKNIAELEKKKDKLAAELKKVEDASMKHVYDFEFKDLDKPYMADLWEKEKSLKKNLALAHKDIMKADPERDLGRFKENHERDEGRIAELDKRHRELNAELRKISREKLKQVKDRRFDDIDRDEMKWLEQKYRDIIAEMHEIDKEHIEEFFTDSDVPIPKKTDAPREKPEEEMIKDYNYYTSVFKKLFWYDD